MTDGLLALSVQCQCNVSQSSTCSNDGSMCFWINRHAIETAHIDNQMPIFSSKTTYVKASQCFCLNHRPELPNSPMSTIAVTSAFGSNAYPTRDTARHRILHMFDCCWYSI